MNNDKLTELFDALKKAKFELREALSLPNLNELEDWRNSYWTPVGKDVVFSKSPLSFEMGK